MKKVNLRNINFSSDKEEIVCVSFDNNYGVEIYPNFESYVQQDVQGQNHIYRYDLVIVGLSKNEKIVYHLFGFKLIDSDRLYNLSQEQAEDIFEEINQLPKYVPHSDVADRHVSEDDMDIVVNTKINDLGIDMVDLDTEREVTLRFIEIFQRMMKSQEITNKFK